MSILYFLCILSSFKLTQQFEDHDEEGIVIEMPASYWTNEEMMRNHFMSNHHIHESETVGEQNNQNADNLEEDHHQNSQEEQQEEPQEEHHENPEEDHHEFEEILVDETTHSNHFEIMSRQESKGFFHQFPARIIVQYDCKYHCNIKGDGVWPLYPCSPKFCACANGIAYTQSCPDILVFDLRYLVCNWQFNVPICN